MTRTRPGGPAYFVLEGLNSIGSNIFYLGIFFHARVSHHFSDSENLMLAVTEGLTYVAATRPGGRFADRYGPDRALFLGLAGMCLSLLAGWSLHQPWVLYASMGIYSAANAMTWPALEAAIARAPGPAPLSRRAGLYNVVWSLVGAAGFFLSGPLFALDTNTVFWAPLSAHLVQACYLALGGRRRRAQMPARIAEQARRDGAERAGGGRGRGGAPAPVHPAPAALERYLRSAWVANGLGYFLFGAFAALSPALGERLGLAPRLAIWLVSSYLFARAAAFVLFWFWGGWAYRRDWLAAALVLQPVALAALFAASTSPMALAALAALGVLSGLAYSASLHASLDREGHEGEGGGLHERVIGIGVLAGPLASATGVQHLGGLAGAGALATAVGAAAALGGLIPLLRRPRGG